LVGLNTTPLAGAFASNSRIPARLSINGKSSDFGAFCPAPGHGLGYNDLKIIEVNRLMKAIAEGAPVPVDLYVARDIEKVIDAWVLSASERQWLDVGLDVGRA